MDATLKRENIKKSIVKFFTTQFSTYETEGSLVFDVWFEVIDFDKWISVNLNEMYPDDLSTIGLTVICLTKADVESWQLTALVDEVLSKVTDIPFYDTSNDSNWVPIGYLSMFLRAISDEGVTADKQKYIAIEYDLKWGAKY